MDTNSSPTMAPHSNLTHQPVVETLDERTTTKDSMVTIRLSGASFAGDKRRPLSREAQQTVHAEPISIGGGNKSSMASLEEQNEAEFDSDNMPRSSHSGSPDSAIITTDEPDMEINAYIKKHRSNSMISIVSEESGRVDWEELEKSEKQEQRDEGSDAVSDLDRNRRLDD